MRYIFLLFFIATASADNQCQGVFFNKKYYNVQVVKEGINKVHQIVLNRRDNTAYFTLDQLSEEPTRVLAYLKLDTKEAGILGGVRNATGLAMDHQRNRLYIGGSDGLFMINMNLNNKVVEKLPVNDDIKYLSYKDNVVYYVNRRREGYKFEFGESVALKEVYRIFVDKIVPDDDDNLFFLQGNLLSRVKIGTRIVNTHERYVVSDVTTDINFKPYISAGDGIYVYNKYKYALDKVANMRDLKLLVFLTSNDPFYVIKDKLIRLIESIPCLGD